ncbi:trypsin-like peptidase domain-containing protein, partial [Candidatus Gribaldobacteria bacterium]|nr:trypsin-like peptidase domain-containing protein [Candidatus Gribaldobacteria bacterium]
MLKESNNIVKIVKNALPAVVSIAMSEKQAKPSGILSSHKSENNFGFKQPQKMKLSGGTGFLVDKTGTILTNRHVVEDKKAEYLVILPNGEKIKPEIIARDELNDVAILKINKNIANFIHLGDSSKLELGQTVVAIGNALGLFHNTVSTGVVSGLSREIKAQSETNGQETSLRGLIQTDAAINPGNSGGPLLDLSGKAIGINAAMVFGAENIGFALPINNARRDLDELKKYGRIRKPFLGIRYLTINPEIKEELNLPINKGALVIAEPDITQRN